MSSYSSDQTLEFPTNPRRRFSITEQAVKVLAGLMLTAVVLSACGGGSEISSQEFNPPTEVPKFEFPVGRNWRRDFEFLPTRKQDEIVFTAWQALIEKCMSSKNIAYEQLKFVGDTWADSLNPLDKQIADKFGFHNPYESVTKTISTKLSSNNQLAFEDCARRSGVSTYGKLEPFKSKLESIFNGLLAAYADAGNKIGNLLMPKWSACMHTSHVTAKSQDELSLKFERAKSISKDEVKIRKLDIACDEKTQLTASRSKAEEVAIGQWRRDHVSEMKQLQELYRTISLQIVLIEQSV